MNTKDKILEYLIKNKVSTTEVADAMGKTGLVKDVFPMNESDYKVGYVHVCFAWNNTNYNIHKQLREVKEDEVVFICSYEFGDIAIIGELMAKYALTYQRAEALVVMGKVRDTSKLYKERYPIWSKGYTPIGCNNMEEISKLPKEFQKEVIEKFHGGIAVCDASGVVVIPSNCLDEDMLERLHLIEIQEDIWNYSLNVLGWSTKDIVADKRYYNEGHLFPEELNKYFSKLKKGFSRKRV